MGIMEIVLPAVVSFILTAAAGKLLIPALVLFALPPRNNTTASRAA